MKNWQISKFAINFFLSVSHLATYDKYITMQTVLKSWKIQQNYQVLNAITTYIKLLETSLGRSSLI